MAVKISDVAKSAGVGIGTVSRVLNGGSVNQKTKETVMRVGAELGYKPNSMAKRLREQRNNTIALMVPVLYHPFFSKLADCVEREADKFGYSMLLVASQRHVEKEKNIIERIEKREVDGAIFVTHFDHDPEEFEGLPLVSIDRHLADGIPYVTSDNYEATKNGVEYLLQRGCKRVGFIGTKPIVESEVMYREKAYRDVMRSHGMEEIAVNEVIGHGDEEMLVKKFLDMYGDVDGVFASGYSIAQAFYAMSASVGKKFPDDCQLVSYDGVFDIWGGAMTCIQQPIEAMSASAVKLLIDKIEGRETPVRTVHNGTFVVGATTKQ